MDRETSPMQYKRLAGRTLPAVSALVMLAACSNATNSVSNRQSADATPVASVTSVGSHSVSDVSDAVGQRLDTMLATRQGSGAVSR
jgi:ABC-type phosphate transport system substrate-binding protein